MKQHGNLVKVLLEGDADTDVESEKVIRQAFLEEFYVVKATYTELFENANTGTSNGTMVVPAPNCASNSRLPRIELSKFEGDYKTFITV
ncbi:hypothetical protein JTB14_026446 [Gonioctena quinquepunctata]|nr:hypothetical protein JTB14_026446 [Gonioctena quinquepunctata]